VTVPVSIGLDIADGILNPPPFFPEPIVSTLVK